MVAQESYEAFRALAPEEVLERAKDAEERPRASGPSAIDIRIWRRLYRDMRTTGARTVGDLKRHVVEGYAAKLGYGYFRYGGDTAFLPFEGAR